MRYAHKKMTTTTVNALECLLLLLKSVLNEEIHPIHQNTVFVPETGRCNALVTAMSGISGSKLHLFHINNVLYS